MTCSHTDHCPLFPKLKASLGAWRTHYCDTDAGWTACARYKRSLSGQTVPLALLPNGKLIGVLSESDDPQRRAATTDLPTPVGSPTASAAASNGAAATATLTPNETVPIPAAPPARRSWLARLFGRESR